MTQTTWIIALGFLLAGLLSLAGFTFLTKDNEKGIRKIQSLVKLRRSTSQAVESGKRIHVSLGSSSILGPNNASALIGLSALRGAVRIGQPGDRPPLATSGNGTLTILSQDMLLAATQTTPGAAAYQAEQVQLTGTTPLAYLTGMIPLQRSEQVATNVLAGYYGPEMALLCEEARRGGAFTLAASESLSAQAALFAAADETLIGEEIFALPAYLEGEKKDFASLHAQDVLRWVLTAALVIGAMLKLVESLPGITIP